jgi:hypothetical protein
MNSPRKSGLSAFLLREPQRPPAAFLTTQPPIIVIKRGRAGLAMPKQHLRVDALSAVETLG